MERLTSVVFFLACICSACSPNKSKAPPVYQPEVFNAKWLTGEFMPDSGTFYLAGEQGSIVWSADGKKWHYSQSPSTNAMRDIAANDSQKVMVAVGEGGTIIRSTDKGKLWRNTNIELPASLDFSHTRLNRVIYLKKSEVWLAAGANNAILHSKDGGLSWKLVSFKTGKDKLEILDLFVVENSGEVLFAAQHGTMGRSHDGGLTWKITTHDMDVSGVYIPNIVGFHQVDKTLIAAADHGRMLISADDGISWQLKKIPTAGYFTDSAYDSENKVIALTTQTGEIAISKDKGETWSLIKLSVNTWPSDDVPLLCGIIYDKTSQSFLAVGNSGLIAQSADGGRRWYANIYKPAVNLSVTTLLQDSENQIYVVAGMGGMIAYQKTSGTLKPSLTGWELIRPGIDQYIREVLHLPDSNTFIAVGQLGGIWRSEDDGQSWKVIDVRYPYNNQPPHLRDIVQDPETDALVAAGPAGSIIRSTDDGMSWKSTFQGEIAKGEAFTQLLYDSKNKEYLAIEVLYRSVYQSEDGGLSWKKIAKIDSSGRNLWHGVISKKMDLVMVLGQKGGIAISRDGGANWEMVETNTENDLYGAYTDNDDAFLLGVGENGAILRSENGTDWELINSNTASTLRRVVKDPDTGALIAFGQNGTIVRSTNSGLDWSKAEIPAYSGELRTAFIEGYTKNLIIVGRDGAVLRSVDGGISWQFLKSHTKQHFRRGAINPETGTLIIVGEGLVKLKASPN